MISEILTFKGLTYGYSHDTMAPFHAEITVFM